MNDQQIYELIAKTPKIRAVTVADSLDVALEDARAALQVLVAVGDVEEHKIFAPNGLPDTGYDFSDEFKKSKEYRALLSMVFPPMPADAPTGTRIDRAIAFVKERVVATSAELHMVMGLQPNEYASSYLSSALRSGRLMRGDDKHWRLGAVQGPQQKVHESVEAAVKAERKKAERPSSAASIAAIAVQRQLGRVASGMPPDDVVAAAPAQSAAPSPAFRCGLWSDGTVEIQRDGVQVAKLTRNEGDQLAAFMGRMQGVAEQVGAD